MSAISNNSLDADILVLTVGASALDREIRKDPPKAEKTFAGKKCAEVTDARYLFQLADFLDWCAGKTETEAEGMEKGDERSKKLKYARWDRQSAAVARHYARKLTFKSAEAPF
jgi:hypothetical protein